MKKLYLGSGFFIGVFFVSMAAFGAVLMAWYAFDQKLWIAGLFSIGMVWFGHSSFNEFISWFSIPPHKYLRISDKTIETSEWVKLIAGLREIQLALLRVQKKVNFVPAGDDVTAVVKFVFKDGTELKFRAGQGSFTTFSPFGKNLGEDDVNSLLAKINSVRTNSGVPLRQMELSAIVK